MVYTLANQTITTTDTPQRFNGSGGARVPATWVNILANDDNSGDLYVGGADPTSAATKQSSLVNQTSGTGIKLTAGSSMFFPVVSTTTPYDLHEMWVSGTADDVFSITYLVK